MIRELLLILTPFLTLFIVFFIAVKIKNKLFGSQDTSNKSEKNK